jgi:hypothetical protein
VADVKPRSVTVGRRAWWGPVGMQVSDERTVAQAPSGPEVAIECPLWQEGGRRDEVVAMLRSGLPVTIDGEHRITLRQPERRASSRRRRRILVEGDRSIVPAGLLLRARCLQGLGLETSTALGAGADRRLVKPPPDLLFGVPLVPARVDRSVTPELVALWLAASNRLVVAAHLV